MSLLKAFNIQKRVIHALILRETRTRFDRNKLGYLWALFEPITYIIVLIGVFAAMGRASPIGDSSSLPMFFLSGLAPWLLFSHTATKCMEGIIANGALLTYPQVTPFDVLISRAFLELVTFVIVFISVFLLLAYFGFYEPIESLEQMAAAVVSLWLLAIGLGFMNSSIKLHLPSYSQTYAAIQRPFFFVSGIFFTADSLPPTLREIALYNPILHAIEWTRSAVFTNYESQYLDKTYLLTIVVVMLAVGLSAERVTRKYARQA